MVRLLIKGWLLSAIPGLFVLHGIAFVLWLTVVPVFMTGLMECRRYGLI